MPLARQARVPLAAALAAVLLAVALAACGTVTPPRYEAAPPVTSAATGATAATIPATAPAVPPATTSVAVPGDAPGPDRRFAPVLAAAARQVAVTDAAVPPGRYPNVTGPDGRWQVAPPHHWTSGFLPGQLWLLYEATGDPAWRARAEARQAAIAGQRTSTGTHDLGFMVHDSFGNAHRLTGTDAFRQVDLAAAASLAKRYDPTVGAVRSWGPVGDTSTFTVIIDNMVNLELLFWAARHGGDPALRDVAVSHALRTRAEHVRPDGSTYHVVEYDPATGVVLRKRSAQGFADDSTWARGQAWAVYGFTVAWRETRDARFLDTARRTADWYLDHLPTDHVPYWDFDAPGIPDAPRDSSAAAVAASGLLELATLEPDVARATRYRGAATATLSSLARGYLARPGQDGVLLHATVDARPGRGGADVATAWGDYYFLEALNRLRRSPNPSPAPPPHRPGSGPAPPGGSR